MTTFLNLITLEYIEVLKFISQFENFKIKKFQKNLKKTKPFHR